MGAQGSERITRERKRRQLEDLMIEKGRDYLLYKHYRLGHPIDQQKLIHINKLHRAYKSEDCEVQLFIDKQYKLKHKYLDITNTSKCEEIDICYNK